jgi:hypothetical protein
MPYLWQALTCYHRTRRRLNVKKPSKGGIAAYEKSAADQKADKGKKEGGKAEKAADARAAKKGKY